MKTNRTEQGIVFYKGRVQGVGFRAGCRSLSKNFAVCGHVKNLPDGRVELLAEGERKEIQAFLAAIRNSQLGEYIRDEQFVWAPADGRYHSFDIAF